MTEEYLISDKLFHAKIVSGITRLGKITKIRHTPQQEEGNNNCYICRLFQQPK